jgi:hypothetical protein
MRLVTLFWLLAASLAAQTGSIEGVVLNHADGKPLSNVHVTLLVPDMAGGGIEKAYGAISDRAGHFSVTGMPAGAYFILLRCTGFIQERVAGMIPIAVVALKDGQHITGYKVEMSSRAVIAGRVVDDFGDPVQNVSVQVEAVSADLQQVNMFGMSGGPATDDHGEFRLVTAPGRYYLRAQPRNFGQGRGPEIRTDGSSTATFANSVYYPNTTNKDLASVVEVGPGQDVTGLEIHLTRVVREAGAGPGASRSLTISGIVNGVPEGERATVLLRFGENAASLQSSQARPSDPDGKFSISGLQPRFYRVVAQYSSGKTRLQSQPVDLHLTSSDASGIQLTLAPGDDLTGSLEISGAAGASAPKLSVTLEPVDSYGFGSGNYKAPAAEKDGSFHIPGLFAARYRVSVAPIPDNGFVKSITVDGAAVEGDVIDLSHGVRGSRVKVAVSLNGGQISGKVFDHDGEPLVSPLGMLMVWKEKNPDQPDNEMVKNSQYSLTALRPGKYRIIAVDAADLLEISRNITNPEEMEKAMKALAEEIEIKEGDRIVKDFKVADKEKFVVKPKQ